MAFCKNNLRALILLAIINCEILPVRGASLTVTLSQLIMGKNGNIY